MLEIRVQFTTQLKALLGSSDVLLQLPAGSTVQDVVEHLADLYQDAFTQRVVDQHRQLLPSVLVCLNDQQVDTNAELSDSATVTFLSAISGG